MIAYYINQIVNSIQNINNKWVSSTINDKDLAKYLHSFVDTQAEYTKATVNNFQDTSIALACYAADKTRVALENTKIRIEKFSTID